MFTFWRVIILFLLIGPSLGLPPLRGMVPRGRTRPHPNTAGSTNEKFHNCNAYKWDVYHDILAAAAYISETFGKLDVLVNNAAVHFDVTLSLSVREEWTSTFATNVVGTAVLTDKLLPLLRKSEFPRIVFVSSTKIDGRGARHHLGVPRPRIQC
ncbi:Short-chain dehydrogenase/reductase tropE [Colletotrichum siamense]|nr:Short-chain dehydrogenase/reductase tropE [Colletotrichum siamense]